MSYADELMQTLQIEITKSVDHQILVKLMTECNGWHAVQVDGPPHDEEIQEWVNSNFKYKSMGRDGLWAFEDKEEYFEFIMRFK